MKHIHKKTGLLLALALMLALAGCRGKAPEAPTVTPEPTQAPHAWTELDVSRPLELDLDGDGRNETVTLSVDDVAYVTHVTVHSGEAKWTDVIPAALSFITAYSGSARAGDGAPELYLYGDEASNDYMTYVYRLRGGKLERAEFEGVATGTDGSGLVGRASVVDVFGTYGGDCLMRLEDDFTFTRASSYTIQGLDEPDMHKLTLKRNGLPFTREDGSAGTFAAGQTVRLVETDEESFAVLEDAQGARCRVEIERRADDWQWYIGGVPESDWFEMLMYAG